MDRSDTIKLISMSYTTDSIGQRVPAETVTEIFCKISSVGYNEFYQAHANGITPEYTAIINRNEYSGEKEAEYKGVRYMIYRTYIGKGENLELYLERKAGV